MLDLPMDDVTVLDMMQARDDRVCRQKQFLQGGSLLICLTMNIPGPRKVSPLIHIAFEEGKHLIAATLEQAVLVEEVIQKTGLEAYYLIDGNHAEIKRTLCMLEDHGPLGRLFDIDLLAANGEKISREELGFPPRRCFMCEQPAFACARSRTHSVAEMNQKIEQRIAAFYREKVISRLKRAAVAALEMEARTTPKPGLVDERNRGSHPDMTLEMMLRSAASLEGYFANCAQLGFDQEPDAVFASLQAAGIAAEKEMLTATGGVNTHKGAVFSLGVLCAAAAHCAATFRNCPETIFQTSSIIAKAAVEQHFSSMTEARTFGEKLYISHRIRGIRGEVADGFPTLLHLWKDFMSEAENLSLQTAGVRSIIRLLSRIQDTTLIKRGGWDGYHFAAAQAQRIEENSFPEDDILALDDEMIARNLTCGGCADLLACLYFLYITALNEQSPENPS